MAINFEGLMINRGYNTGSPLQNSFFVGNIPKLADFLNTRDFIDQLTANKAKEFISSLTLFPFPIPNIGTGSNLNIGYNNVGVPYSSEVIGYPVNRSGVFMGQMHYVDYPVTYKSFEPYTELHVYLPFYGTVQLPIAEVLDKYIQFRLFIDYATGMATYVIGVTDEIVLPPPSYTIFLAEEPEYGNNNGEYTKPQNITYVDDSNTRIIGTYEFQLGYTIPIGTSDSLAGLQNMILSASKIASVVGNAQLGNHTSKATTVTYTENSPTDTDVVFRSRNPQTHRMNIDKTVSATKKGGHSTRRSTRVYDHSNQVKNRAYNEAFSTAVDALNSNIRVSSESSNNVCVNRYSSNQIQIFRYKKKLVEQDATFKHLFGLPLGTTKKLGDLTGYTEISNIHLDGFTYATTEELSLIEQALSNGFIL